MTHAQIASTREHTLTASWLMSLGKPSTLTLVDRGALSNAGTRAAAVGPFFGPLAGPVPGLGRFLLIFLETFFGPVLLFLLACLAEPIISSKD